MVPLIPDEGKVIGQDQPRQLGQKTGKYESYERTKREQAGKQKSPSQKDLLFSPPSELPYKKNSVISLFHSKAMESNHSLSK